MFVRALVLTILIICSVASTLPLSGSLAHWASRPSASRRHKGRHARRHSRAWWRRYRARLRRQRAVAAERRRRRRAAMMTATARRPASARRPTAARPATLFTPAANHAAASNADAAADSFVLPGVTLPTTASLSSITPVKAPPAIVPATKDALQQLPRPAASPLPSGWSNAASSRAGEMRFNVRAADGRMRSSAVWSRVNLQAAASSAADARSKSFGGVPVTLLRRTVINRMVAEGGWVTNDILRQVGERRVLVVTAQSIDANGERRAWAFYFTESEGQVYSLATNAPAEYADALAAESEQAVAALGARRANSTTAQR